MWLLRHWFRTTTFKIKTLFLLKRGFAPLSCPCQGSELCCLAEPPTHLHALAAAGTARHLALTYIPFQLAVYWGSSYQCVHKIIQHEPKYAISTPSWFIHYTLSTRTAQPLYRFITCKPPGKTKTLIKNKSQLSVLFSTASPFTKWHIEYSLK